MKDKELYEWFEQQHRKMWGYEIAIERKDKEQVFKEIAKELATFRKRLTTPLQRNSLDLAIKLSCFACGAMLLKTKAIAEDLCNCPVIWQNSTNYCLDPNTYYEQYYQMVSKSQRVTVKAARVAKKISKLKWKKWEER